MHIEGPVFFKYEADIPATATRIDATQTARSEAERALGGAQFLEPQWVYYPWRNVAICLPQEDIYFALRTARNRDVITQEEQDAFRSAMFGIAGLSVGSAVLELIVATGGPKKVRIADPDTLEITNLNRIRGTLLDVGLNKTLIASRRVWEMDPFAHIDAYSDGISGPSIDEFLSGLTLVIDEMDTIPLKFAIRERARDMRIPVIMGTDNGDGAIIDVERFDTEPGRPIFHGRVDPGVNTEPKTKAEFSALAAQIIDPSLFTIRQADSVRRVGSGLPGVPQLATAVATTAAGVAYAARMIATKQDLPSGRYVLGPDLCFTGALATPS